MTHGQFSRAVALLVIDFGLLGYSHPDSRRSRRRGFPDWVILGPRGLLWRELKTGGDVTTADQDNWLFMLTGTGQDAAIWTERELADGSIERELIAIGGHRR